MKTGAERMVRTGCPSHNCGGRCLLRAHIKDGVIVRLETDDRPDCVEDPQLRACPRGRAYLRRQYHPDRLLHPMKRIGRRGEGRFERISWDEALDTLAAQMVRVRKEHGDGALFVPYGTGGYSQLTGSQTARRLMNLSGGCLGIYNSYSWGATNLATPTVYGTLQTGNQRQDWLNTRIILLWGWNPAEMRDGTNSDYLVKEARRRGARTVCIDPRLSPSAVALADEWVPIRPGTDVAMMSAMAYVMVTEDLYDAGFVRGHCIGFDSSRMPAGCEREESYREYLLGTRDGIPKTPAWAEAITAVPRETIVRLAREYATVKPGVLYQGYGMQRRAFGEQVVRAGCVLAALTGNVGIPGGWAGGLGLQPPDGGPFWNIFPLGENPFPAGIPVFLWTEGVLRGHAMDERDGVILSPGSERPRMSDIKLIYAVATNCLINQHANINRTARILSDESLVEFLAVQDNFLTPTGRFADLLLPACTQFETWGVEDGWKYGDEVLLMPQLVDPPGEARSDYRICAGVAERLGIGAAYTEGRDERGWVEWILDRYRETRFPGLPSLEEMRERNLGVYSNPVREPAVAFTDFRRDPEKHPLNTPSGKIEIFSRTLYERARSTGQPEAIPAIPKYIQEWESPFGPESARAPLQAIGHHSLRRVHSTLENVDWLEEAFPQRVFLNPIDAGARGIADGEQVRVYNQRGALVCPCRVTPRIMPGVIDIPQGAWWTPDEEGTDRRGSINVLTSERWTPFAFGSTQHTIMVEVERAEGPARSRPEPAGTARSSDHGAPHASLSPGSDPALGSRLFFHFDSSACSGCKACQIACKDRHGLGPGVLYRRVYEVSGGGWSTNGAAWLHDVFAYNLSLGCNHCLQPICVEVCPASAYSVRSDGVVLLDSARCLGCRYCSWACPYGAPQFDPESGRMGKCSFCAPDLDEGKPPACVSACPMRALDWGTAEELAARHTAESDPRPLPDPDLTRPAQLVTRHAQAKRARPADDSVGNREEVEFP